MAVNPAFIQALSPQAQYEMLLKQYLEAGGTLGSQVTPNSEGGSTYTEPTPVQLPGGMIAVADPSGGGIRVFRPGSSAERGQMQEWDSYTPDGQVTPGSYRNPEQSTLMQYAPYIPLAFALAAGGAQAAGLIGGSSAAGTAASEAAALAAAENGIIGSTAGAGAGGAVATPVTAPGAIATSALPEIAAGGAAAASPSLTVGGAGAGGFATPTLGGGLGTGAAYGAGTAAAAGIASEAGGSLAIPSVGVPVATPSIPTPGVPSPTPSAPQAPGGNTGTPENTPSPGTGGTPAAPGTPTAPGGSTSDIARLIQAIGGGLGGIGSALGGLGGNDALGAAQLLWQIQQWREANGQAKDLQGLAKQDQDAQRGIVNNTLGLSNALRDRSFNELDQSNTNRFDPNAKIEGVADFQRKLGEDQITRALTTDARGGLIDSLQTLGDNREAERRTAFNEMQGSIGDAERRFDQTYADLGVRRQFGEADVDAKAKEIYDARVGGLDRALKIASSQGYADAFRRGVNTSTQAELSRDDITRRFADKYSELDASSRESALGQVTGFSNLQDAGRTGALRDLTSAVQPTMNARIQGYRPDDTAVTARTQGANYGLADRGQQQSFANALNQTGNQTTGQWLTSGQQGQQLRQSNVTSLLNALNGANQTGNYGAANLARTSSDLAAAGTAAAGTAQARMFSGATGAGGTASTAGSNVFGDLLRSIGGIFNPTTPSTPRPTDRTDYTYLDPNLRPGSI
jgi:hypothetical protein